MLGTNDLKNLVSFCKMNICYWANQTKFIDMILEKTKNCEVNVEVKSVILIPCHH